MWGTSLLGVTRAAGGSWLASVRLVALAAITVARDGRLLLGPVATAAFRRHDASVRLVAVHAATVSGLNAGALLHVAHRAVGAAGLRAVGEPLVAASAPLMTRRRRHARELGSVASLAGAAIGALSHEVVRSVTTLALDAAVKLPVVRGAAVARAAVAGARRRSPPGRVRIVAADTSACSSLSRMIRVGVAVTAHAGLSRAIFYVVSRVTAGAVAMPRGSARASQYGQLLVAATARHRLLFCELVRLMAPHAGRVPACEQRAGSDDRLGLAVAGLTRRYRLGGRRVLLLVARRARLAHGLAFQRVGRRHVGVTRLAGARLRRQVGVRAVAIQTFAGVVDSDGGSRGLARRMAVQAVSRLVTVQRTVAREPFESPHPRAVAEAVAERAIAAERLTEARAGLG